MSDTGPTVVDGGGGTEVMHKEDSIEMQAKRLCTSIREAAAEHARQRDEVAADRQLLTDEKQRMEGAPRAVLLAWLLPCYSRGCYSRYYSRGQRPQSEAHQGTSLVKD